MNYIKKNLFNIILIVFMLILPVLSLAQIITNPNPPATSNVTIINPIASKTIIQFVRNILDGVIKIGMPIIVLAIIYCGFLFVSAQGKSEKLEEAKKALLYTLIGAAILLGSWAIAQLIVDTVKVL